MKRCIWIVFVGAMAAVAFAADGELASKVTEVTIFKDGHALVLTEGEGVPASGRLVSANVPAALLGTYWSFSKTRGVELEAVRARTVEVDEPALCRTVADMVRANVGRKCTLYLGEKMDSLSGTIEAVPARERDRESVITRRERTYNRWGNYSGQREVREAETTSERLEAEFAIIQMGEDGGKRIVRLSDIRSVRFHPGEGGRANAVRLELPKKNEERRLEFRLRGDASALRKPVVVGTAYIQRGLRWIPEYRIELKDGKAHIRLQATIVNELADLQDVKANLVVGVPSFLMQGELSPLALREVGLRLGRYFQPPSRGGGGGSSAPYLSNAMMSQVAMPAREARGVEAGGPDIGADAGVEDLFVFPLDRLTLKQGECASLRLIETTVGYQDLYAWDIPPAPPRELWRHFGNQQRRQLAEGMLAAKVRHVIEMKNTGKAPWTTGPAMIFKDGVPLAQQLLTYTSVGNTCELPVTVATDVNGSREDAETARTPNITINDDRYTRINMKGKLRVKNFKDREIRLRVTRAVFGEVQRASDGGKIRAANAIEEAAAGQEYWPGWWSWNWPWWWAAVNPISEVTWETRVPAGKTVEFEISWEYYRR